MRKTNNTAYSEYFCPECGKYSGESFTVIFEGDSPPDSEVLKCRCGWIGSWIDCVERKERMDKVLENKSENTE